MLRGPFRILLAATVAAAGLLLAPIPDEGNGAAALPVPASHVVDDRAAAWPACTSVGYRVNTTFAPPGALQDVTRAIETVSEATGLRFTYLGPTDRIPQATDLDTATPDPQAPLVIAWAHRPDAPAGASTLLDGTATLAGRTNVSATYRKRMGVVPASYTITAADVVIQAGETAGSLPTYGGITGDYAFILHELGHAVGLDHTSAAGSLMNPILANAQDHFGELDTLALKTLNDPGRCRD